MKWENLSPELRERIIKQEPEHFNQAGIVGRLQKQKPKSDTLPPLDYSQKGKSRRERRMVVIVTLVSFRHRLLDSDNCEGSFKGLRDAVARSIGVDDGDKRFRWECRQVETAGKEGTLVTIEVIG